MFCLAGSSATTADTVSGETMEHRQTHRAMQRSIVGVVLDLLEHAWMTRTTVQKPFPWETIRDVSLFSGG